VNINKFKPYQYLGQTFRGLEATIEGGGEHKEDSENKEDKKRKEKSRKHFEDVFTKNITQLKTSVNPKKSSFLHWRTNI
jgi:hypothetical protein